MSRRAAALAALLACLTTGGASGAESPTKAYVLDAGAPALVALDLVSGRRAATLPLSGMPSWFRQSDDGRYLVVLDRGPGEDKGARGYKAKGRSSATIVDAASLKAIGRVELGAGVESVQTAPDGRLTVTTAGYDAKDPREALPRELVVAELATAKEIGRLPLEPGTDLTWRSADGRTLALLQGQPRTEEYPFPRSKVTIVDVAGPTVAATLDASGWNQAERDAERLYLVAFGRPDKNLQKNRNGAVDVVSFADRKVTSIDLGRSPLGALRREDGWFALLSEGPPGSPGELRLLRDGVLTKTVPVAATPRYLGEHADAVWVVGAKAATLLNPKTLEATANIPLETAVDDDDRPFEVAASTDGRRAFVHYPAQDKVVVLDLEHGKAIGSTKTGRGGKKLLNTLAEGLNYNLTGRLTYDSGGPYQLVARPDGRFGYALNVETNDVTVVDGDTAQAVAKIAAKGRALVPLGASTLIVVGPSLHLIDTSSNQKVGEVDLPGLLGFLPAEDGSLAVALAERTVVILDGASGRERARLTDLVRPTRVAFANASSAAETPTR